MRCHYIYTKEAGKVHIPGCWGAALFDPSRCTCYDKTEAKLEEDKKIKDLKADNKHLEKENAQLWRIIRSIHKKTNLKVYFLNQNLE